MYVVAGMLTIMLCQSRNILGHVSRHYSHKDFALVCCVRERELEILDGMVVEKRQSS